MYLVGGFSLDDIRELLAIRLSNTEKSCSDVKAVTEHQLLAVEQKINELSIFKRALKQLHNNCCGGSESAVHCTILHALESTASLKKEG